jgi:hypothetical protein
MHTTLKNKGKPTHQVCINMIYTAWELSKYDLVHELPAALQSQFLDHLLIPAFF